MGFVQV